MNYITQNIGGTNVQTTMDDIKITFIENILKTITPHVSENQLNLIKHAIISELNKVEVIDPYKRYEENNDDFESIVRAFINVKKLGGLSPRTLEYYESTLLRFNEYTKKPIKAIMSNDILNYLGMKGQSCSNVTLNNVRRILSSFFGWTHNMGYILQNPMVMVPKIKERKTVKQPFTVVELEKLRNYFTNRIFNRREGTVRHVVATRDLAIFEFLLASGVRVNELCHIKLKDINFTDLTVKVLGKGNKERETLFNTRARTAIETYLKVREEYYHTSRENDWWLFSGETGVNVRLEKSGVERCMRNAGRKSGIPKVHPHRFRRTFATTLVNHDMPIELVQQLLGHNSLNTTMIYVNLDKTRVRASYDKILNG